MNSSWFITHTRQKQRESCTDLLLWRRSFIAAVVVVFTAMISRVLTRNSISSKQQQTRDKGAKANIQNASPDESHLPVLPLVQVHHCSVKVRDQVLADEVNGWNCLFWRRGHGAFHLGVDLMDVGQLLQVRGHEVRVGLDQTLPVKESEQFSLTSSLSGLISSSGRVGRSMKSSHRTERSGFLLLLKVSWKKKIVLNVELDW